MPPSRQLRTICILSCAGLLSLPTAAFGVAKTVLQDPASYSSTYVQPVAPGVDITGYRSAARGGIALSNVVTVNLDQPGVSTGLLSSRVTDVKRVATFASESGAVVAVNADYYAIGTTNAPEGPAIRGGALQKALARKRYVQGVGIDGVVRRDLLWLDGTVRWGKGSDVHLERYNSALDGADMPKDSISLFDARWGSASVSFGRAPSKVSYVLVGRNGKVLKSSRKFTPQRVPAGGLLLVGTGRWASIGSLPKGSSVRQHTAAVTSAPVPFAWAVGGGLELVRNGNPVHHSPESNADPHAARTAMGWSKDGRTLKLVTVERSASSVGHGTNEIADEMRAQGVWQAVLLDGGGSTTLQARPRGSALSNQIGATQDPSQRAVANAIGVFVPRGSGQLNGIDVSPNSSAVFPGLQRRIQISAYDEWYGPARADVAAATLTSTNGLVTQSGTQLVRAGTTGTDTVTATLGPVNSSTPLRVLDPLASLRMPDEVRIDPGSQAQLPVQGVSSRGERAPIDALDVSVTPSGPAVSAVAGPAGELFLRTKPGSAGAAEPVTISVGAVSQVVLVRSGYRNADLSDLGANNVWAARGAKSSKVNVGRHYGGIGLRLLLQKQGTTTLTPKAGPVVLPGDAVRIALNVKADGRRHTVRVIVADATGRTSIVTLGTTGPKKGWTRYDVVLSPGATQLRAIQIIGPGGDTPGEITLDGLIARS